MGARAPIIKHAKVSETPLGASEMGMERSGSADCVIHFRKYPRCVGTGFNQTPGLEEFGTCLPSLRVPAKPAHGGVRPGAGRPRTNAPRCACGAMTAKRAAHQSHKCSR